MNRADLQRLSGVRFQEAKALLTSGKYSGAYYLAGYAVECALKACVAKSTQRHDFPDKARVQDSYSHSLTKLMTVAGLDAQLRNDTQGNQVLATHGALAQTWSEQSRYKLWSRADAESMLQAVGKRRDGVIPWIKLRW